MNIAETLTRMVNAARSPHVRATAMADVVLLVVFVSIVLAYWWPKASAEQALAAKIEETRRAVTDAMQANDVLSAYARATRATEAIERKLQAPVKQAQLVQSLAALARRHEVRIVSESYEEGRRQAEYVPLFLQVALEGRYAAIRGFLGEIYALPLWVEVEDARLERLREPAGLMKAQLRLRVVRRSSVAMATSGS